MISGLEYGIGRLAIYWLCSELVVSSIGVKLNIINKLNRELLDKQTQVVEYLPPLMHKTQYFYLKLTIYDKG